MCIDKQLARKKQFRIPESVLLMTAFLGGSFGSLFGMAIFRHKTRKLRFRIWIPVFIVIHIVLLFRWL